LVLGCVDGVLPGYFHGDLLICKVTMTSLLY